MDTEERRGAPVACSLSEEQERERRDELTRDLFALSTGTTELDDGYEYAFPEGAALAKQLVGFVVEERECCPFLVFELFFEPDRGPIRLRVRGPEGAKEFLRRPPDEGD